MTLENLSDVDVSNVKRKSRAIIVSDEESVTDFCQLIPIQASLQEEKQQVSNNKLTSESIIAPVQPPTNEKKIVMKIFRGNDHNTYTSISCSEDETSKGTSSTSLIASREEFLPKIAAISSLSTTSKNTTIEIPKVQSRGKDLSLARPPHTSPNFDDDNNSNKDASEKVKEIIKVKKHKKKSRTPPEQLVIPSIQHEPVAIISKVAPAVTTTTTATLNTKTIVPTVKSNNLKTSTSSNSVAQTTKKTGVTSDKQSTTKPIFKIPRINHKPAIVEAPIVQPISSSESKSNTDASTLSKTTTEAPKNSQLTARKAKQKKLTVAVPKKTRLQTVQRRKEVEKNPPNNNTTLNNNNTICVKPPSIDLELLYDKSYKSLDNIHIDTKIFNLINANAYNNRKHDYGLSYLSLNDNEKMQLLKLIRRTNCLNNYEILANEYNKKFQNGDIVINESNLKLNPYLDDEENWIINSLKQLNATEAMAVYKRFKNLLTSPFRSIEAFEDGMVLILIFKIVFKSFIFF